MKLIKKYPSILNWLDPKFSLTQLSAIKSSNLSQSEIYNLLKYKYSKNKFNTFIDSINKKIDLGFNIICPLDEEYSYKLNFVFNKPTPLIYKGNLYPQKKILTVVGSRKVSQLTKDWMHSEFSNFLKDNKDIVIASGGAYGVDQLAHKISLLNGGITYCVLPTGVNNVYPKNLRPICRSIIDEGGAVLSPFPPNFPVYKSNFYYRNRVLVLISDFVFVVEARRRSGTMMTAGLAAEYGVNLVTLPQIPTSNFMGNIDLINSGHSMIQTSEDLKGLTAIS